MNEFIDTIIDWSKFDASYKISERMGGVSKKLLEAEVELWEKQLSLLDPLDYKKIRNEIDSWKVEIPRKDSLNYDNIASTYSALVSYKHRISQLIADAKAWDDTCKEAIDYLTDLAPGAFTGTGADKKSNSVYVAQPFIHLKAQTSRILTFLTQYNGSIEFAAKQLDLLLKERQSQAKLNHKFAHAGEQNDYTSDDNPDELEEYTLIKDLYKKPAKL
jgi:hypothetical protein